MIRSDVGGVQRPFPKLAGRLDRAVDHGALFRVQRELFALPEASRLSLPTSIRRSELSGLATATVINRPTFVALRPRRVGAERQEVGEWRVHDTIVEGPARCSNGSMAPIESWFDERRPFPGSNGHRFACNRSLTVTVRVRCFGRRRL
jgi:hypothetical protein